MNLEVVDVAGARALEGQPGSPFLQTADDVDRLIEGCFSSRTQSVLLYAENLPAAFFDLSSGIAGTMLQRLRNYGMRLAVVGDLEALAASDRFREMAAEERHGGLFGFFETRNAALHWLVP